jgi:hypothetical protein
MSLRLKDANTQLPRDHVEKAQDNIDAYRSHLFNEYSIKAAISKDKKTISFRVICRASQGTIL